jgi:hypothetical protein
MAIVPGYLFAMNPRCPYCVAKDQDYVIDYVDTKQHNITLDIIQCAECEDAYLVSNTPQLLEAKGPIFTKWHVKNN